MSRWAAFWRFAWTLLPAITLWEAIQPTPARADTAATLTAIAAGSTPLPGTPGRRVGKGLNLPVSEREPEGPESGTKQFSVSAHDASPGRLIIAGTKGGRAVTASRLELQHARLCPRSGRLTMPQPSQPAPAMTYSSTPPGMVRSLSECVKEFLCHRPTRGSVGFALLGWANIVK
jgi:hypothetical protein